MDGHLITRLHLLVFLQTETVLSLFIFLTKKKQNTFWHPLDAKKVFWGKLCFFYLLNLYPLFDNFIFYNPHYCNETNNFVDVVKIWYITYFFVKIILNYVVNIKWFHYNYNIIIWKINQKKKEFFSYTKQYSMILFTRMIQTK